MLDPYMVLGVGKYDDDQTVKKAYRQLSKQYHPDNNLNNPNKDAAEETFKKIQLAYEQIMHERSLGIGGPDDLRRKQNAGAATGGSTWNNSTRTAEKERNTYKSSFWNTGFSNNSDNSNSYNNGYNSNNSNGSYGSSYNNGSNNSYGGNYSSYGSNNGNYYSGNNNYNSDNGYGSGTNGYYSGGGGYSYTRGADRSSNGGGYYSSSYDNNRFYGSDFAGPDNNEDVNSILNTVAQNLNNRKFFDAWDILNSMQTRNDVWYYYSAIANLGLGNSITALNHARTAKAMQPGRPEYDELINGIQSGTLHYRGKSEMFVPQKGNAGNTCLKIGLAMIFFNVFCGGGGIACGTVGCCC